MRKKAPKKTPRKVRAKRLVGVAKPEPFFLTAADKSSPAIGPRITPEDITAKIATVSHFTQGVLTVCLVTMLNGFTVVGKAAPVSAVNFDAVRGRELAYEDAFRQLWALEGYHLREKLMGA